MKNLGYLMHSYLIFVIFLKLAFRITLQLQKNQKWEKKTIKIQGKKHITGHISDPVNCELIKFP